MYLATLAGCQWHMDPCQPSCCSGKILAVLANAIVTSLSYRICATCAASGAFIGLALGFLFADPTQTYNCDATAA